MDDLPFDIDQAAISNYRNILALFIISGSLTYLIFLTILTEDRKYDSDYVYYCNYYYLEYIGFGMYYRKFHLAN